MRAYLVAAQPQGSIVKFVIASTQSDARSKRNELVSDLGIKKNDITIEEIDIPTSKNDMLDFINEQICMSYECGSNANKE